MCTRVARCLRNTSDLRASREEGLQCARAIRDRMQCVHRGMQIDQLEVIELGDTRQWIRVRGTDVSNPVLLVMQLGPGLPLINEARSWDRLFGLEEAFTVVYWDQRGTGLTLRKQSHASDLTVAHMVA